MKRICTGILLPALMLIASCTPLEESTSTSELDKIALVTVQCRNDEGIQKIVEHILKGVHVGEWKIDKQSDDMEISARYADVTNPQLGDLERQLNETPGVFHINIIRDRIPPRGL